MKKLLVVGAGTHGRVVAETAAACGYEEIVFLDDAVRAKGTTDDMERLAPCYDGVIVSIGDNARRKELIERLESAHARLITLIHPRAYLSPSAFVGSASVVLPGAVVHTSAVIGKGCILSAGSVVDHDAVVDDFCHINAGTVIGACQHIKALTKL